MEKYIGLITCYDETGAERVIETSDLDSYLRKIGVNLKGRLKNDLFSRFQGSVNRSYWFLNYNYREFTEAELTSEYYMPICGVKEQPEGRRVNYVEWITFPEKILNGEGFSDEIFSVDYVSRNESVYKNDEELRKIITSRKKSVGRGISHEQAGNVSRILLAIWGIQSYDPMGRIVILLDDPENESLELLRQIYLLMPCRLRLQMGFMTNVSAADLLQLGTKGGLPIYIMTTSPSEWNTIKQYSYSFPVYPIDPSELKTAQLEQEKLNTLYRLASDMNAQTSVRLDYVEKKVLESHQTHASSFKYYAEILEKLYSGDMFWWYKADINSVEELESLYKDQSELMENEEYRKEALNAFATSLYPSSNLANRIVEIIYNESYPNREKLLNFLSDDMEMTKQISSIVALHQQLLLEKDQALESIENELRNEFDKEIANEKANYESTISSLKSTHATEIKGLKSTHATEIKGLKSTYATEIKDLKSTHATEINALNASHQEELSRVENEYQSEIKKANDNYKQLEKNLQKEKDKNSSLNGRYTELKTKNASLEKKNTTLVNENSGLNTEIERLNEELHRAGNVDANYRKLVKTEEINKVLKKTVCVALAVLVIMTSISVFMFNNNRKLKAKLEVAQNEAVALSTQNEVNQTNVPEDTPEQPPAEQPPAEQPPAESQGDSNSVISNPADEGANEGKTDQPKDENKKDSNGNSGNKDKGDSQGWESNEAIELLKKVNRNILQFEDSDSPNGALFFHVKFAESDDTDDKDDLSDNTDVYIGTYVDNSSADTTEKDTYFWRKYIGIESGEGFHGTDQENNIMYYLHVGFADSDKGTENFSKTELGNRKYIGFYVDKEKYDSDDHKQYSYWEPIPRK